MSIATEISKLQTAKAGIKTSLEAKGVTVPTETLLGGYPALVDSIATGGGEYSPPADWINIDDCADGNINLLVSDGSLATYAFICTTSGAAAYNVNWGDGTNDDADSGVTAQHTYTVGTGQVCSRGYTTFKIVISPTAGDLASFAVTAHTLALQPQEHHILLAVISATHLTTLANAFYNANALCRKLERCKCIGTFSDLLNTSRMCRDCSSLKVIDMGGMGEVTDASLMFYSCYTLEEIDVSSMVKLENSSSMFSGCHHLSNIDVTDLVEITDCTTMFTNCFALVSINISSMTKVSVATGIFNGCYSLKTIEATNFASAAASTTFNNAFYVSEQITSINFPTAKITTLTARGTAGKLNKLETIIMDASSPLNLGTAGTTTMDLQYNTLSAEQLNTIFTNLPSITSRTINVKGCTGAATCDKTIAEAKGWTVTVA